MSLIFQVRLSNGLRVHSDLSPLEVEASAGFVKKDMNTGYVWYSSSELQYEKHNIYLGLCFVKERLESLTICLIGKQYGAGWSDRSEQNEGCRAKDTAALLAQSGFCIGQFCWGEVWSGYDQKSGFGSVGVRYICANR